MNKEFLEKFKAINLHTGQVPTEIGRLRVRLIDKKSDKLEYDKTVDESLHFLLKIVNVQWELLSSLLLENETDNNSRTSNTTKTSPPSQQQSL